MPRLSELQEPPEHDPRAGHRLIRRTHVPWVRALASVMGIGCALALLAYGLVRVLGTAGLGRGCSAPTSVVTVASEGQAPEGVWPAGCGHRSESSAGGSRRRPG